MTYNENKKICEQFPPEIMYEGLRELVATVNATMTRVVEPGDEEAANDEARVHEIAYTVVHNTLPREIDYPTVYTELQAIHDKYKNRPTNKEWKKLEKERKEIIKSGQYEITEAGMIMDRRPTLKNTISNTKEPYINTGNIKKK